MTLKGAAVLAALASLPASAAAEPIFLSRQYTRCTNCHFSPTGGGLLTPYGRSLSREELSTSGGSGGSATPGREHEFLYGALGDSLRGVSAGISLRPAHVDVEGDFVDESRSFLMNAELVLAARRGAWTAYGQLGRQPRGGDPRVTSFEHWAGYKPGRVGVRAGRFLPAYGVKVADHTSFTRRSLGLENDEQLYALELSYTGDRHLVQVTAGAPADAWREDLRIFTAAARWQVDLSTRLVLVGSGRYSPGDDDPERAGSGSAGVALGFAPVSRLAIWTQADTRFIDEVGRSNSFVADVAFEAHRGVWVRFSPQLLTQFGDSSGGAMRYVVGLNLLPRTHWNVILNYYRDQSRCCGEAKARTLLAQLHLYL